MRRISRLVFALVGLFAIVLAFSAWLQPETLGDRLGLAATRPEGVASFRADIGAFFAVAGGFALWAGIEGRWGRAIPALALFSAALLGRLATLADYPPAREALSLVFVEASVLVALSGACLLSRTQS